MKQFSKLGLMAAMIILAIGALVGQAFAAGTDITDQFTDAAFRSYVLARYDSNSDGRITVEEVSDVRSLMLSERGIASLDGIGYFTALEELQCQSNALTALDLSKNTQLLEVHVQGNRLTSLNLSGCTQLEVLDCERNALTRLDITRNTNLYYLICAGNQLTSLDLSKNSELMMLDCGNNQLRQLDLSANPKLEYFYCYYNQLSVLDLSKAMGLQIVSCADNQLRTLTVSHLEGLTALNAEGNQLSSLDVSKNTALEQLYCGRNQLTGLNIRGLSQLQVVYCDGNRIPSNEAVTGWEERKPVMLFYPQAVAQEGWQNHYTDIDSSDWFYDYVADLSAKGVYGSYVTSVGFTPNQAAARSAVVKCLYQAAGSPEFEFQEVPFYDLEESFYESVLWSQQNGIVRGVGDGRFAPWNAITRQDIAVVFLRYAGYMEVELKPIKEANPFSDDESISDYATEAVEVLYRAEIIEGVGENAFNPLGEVTNAEVATMLFRFLQVLESAA